MEKVPLTQVATVAPLVAGLGVLSWKWLQRRAANPNGLPYPPGPRRAPIIGNLLQLPQEKEWEVYEEWTKIYGT